VLFNSYAFLFGFLPLVLVGTWAMRVKNLRLLFLTLASWAFYAWWDWRFLPLMLSTTTVDYVAALAIHRTDDQRRRTAWLVASLTVNLSLLGYFKYAGFFVRSLSGIAQAVGAPVDLPVLRILLPIGISFYTFNSMSYTIDVWRRRVTPTRHILEYTTFVALFPHLIAGPIVRYTDLAGQLKREPDTVALVVGHGNTVPLFLTAMGVKEKIELGDREYDNLFVVVPRASGDPEMLRLRY